MVRNADDITEAELKVLKELWRLKEATIRELTDRLYPDGGTAHYATVQKLLDRLAAKKCVDRRRDGRSNIYRPAVDRRDLISRRLRQAADALCDGSLRPLLTTLVTSSQLSAEELRELKDVLELHAPGSENAHD